MAKKRRLTITKSVSVEANVNVSIDLDDFETDDLLDEIERRGAIGTRQREAIGKSEPEALEAIDFNDLDKALWSISLRNRDDAVYFLEKAIPSLRGFSTLLRSH